MADKYSGSKLNEGLLNKLKSKTDSIIEDGRRNESAPDKSSLEKLTITKEDGSTEEIYVTAKDKEVFGKINYIKEMLDFGEFEKSQLYDLPGGKITIGGNSSSFRMFLPVVDAPSIVGRIMDLKISEVIDIEFPQEFYRLNSYFKGPEAKMPDTDMEVPRPKKGDESIEEYEQFLEEEYKKHGIEKTPDSGTAWRMPYPHEKIDYKKELENKDKKTKPGISKVEDSNQSGYYPVYVEAQKKVKGKHKKAGAGRHKVTGSRVSTLLGTSKNFIQNLLKARLINLGISKYFIAAAAGVGISTLLLGGGVAAGLTAAAIGAGAMKAMDMIRYTVPRKKKPKNKPITGTDEPITPGSDEPIIDEDIDLSELEAIRTEIEENLKLIKELAAKYDVKRKELQDLNLDPDTNAKAIEDHKAELADLVVQLKELSSNNEDIMNSYMERVNKKGRSL